MNFKIDTDVWYVFTILFVSAFGLFIGLYISIPYYLRKREFKRIKSRQKRKRFNFKKIENKLVKNKVSRLQEENQKLEIDIKDDLKEILKSESKELNFLSFYSNFEKIYPDFISSLKIIIPDITAHELKLCAFLRLNLETKEISQLLNITPSSVNKARYRLRKKLSLDSGRDLFNFISNI